MHELSKTHPLGICHCMTNSIEGDYTIRVFDLK